MASSSGTTDTRPTSIGSWTERLWLRLRAYWADPVHRVMWGLLLLAAILRLSYLDLIEFRPRQAAYLAGAGRILEGDLPIEGVASPLGIPDTPLALYILALPQLLGHDPRLTAAFVALLHVIAIAGLFGICRRYRNVRLAMITTGLLAVCPWGVVLSRRISAESLLLPLTTLSYYALHLALADRSQWGWALMPISITLSILVSYLAMPLSLICLVLILLYHQRASWRHLLFGLCFSFLLLIPTLYRLNITRLADLIALWRAGLAQSDQPAIGWEVLHLAASQFTGQGLASLVTPSSASFRGAGRLLDALTGGLFLLALPSLALSALNSWTRWRERTDSATYIIPLLWLLVSLALVAGRSDHLELRALAITLPVGAVAMGMLFDALFSATERGLAARFWWMAGVRVALWVFYLFVIAAGAYTVIYTAGFVANHDTTAGYGLPFRYWRRIETVVKRGLAQSGIAQVWVSHGKPLAGHSADPAMLDYLLGKGCDAIHLQSAQSEGVLLPAERPGLYLLLGELPATDYLVRRLRGEEIGAVVLPADLPEIRLYAAPAAPVHDLLTLADRVGLWRLDSGANIVGFDWPTGARPGDTARLVIYWMFADVPASERAVAHRVTCALASGGRVVAYGQGLALDAIYWYDGLLLWQQCNLSLPAELSPGQYDLFVNMERLPGEPSLYLSIDGQPLGVVVPLGMVRVGG